MIDLVTVGLIVALVVVTSVWERRVRRKLVRRIFALEKTQMWKQVAAEEGTDVARRMYARAQAEELATREESVLWGPCRRNRDADGAS